LCKIRQTAAKSRECDLLVWLYSGFAQYGYCQRRAAIRCLLNQGPFQFQLYQLADGAARCINVKVIAHPIFKSKENVINPVDAESSLAAAV